MKLMMTLFFNYYYFVIIIIIITIIIFFYWKKSIKNNYPLPTIPTNRPKEDKGKTVEDKKAANSFGQLKSIYNSLEPPVPH